MLQKILLWIKNFLGLRIDESQYITKERSHIQFNGRQYQAKARQNRNRDHNS